MKATTQARIVTRAILKLLMQVNLPRRVIEAAYALMSRVSSGLLDGAADFLRSQLFRCAGALAAVVSLTADLVA